MNYCIHYYGISTAVDYLYTTDAAFCQRSPSCPGSRRIGPICLLTWWRKKPLNHAFIWIGLCIRW